MKFKLYNLQILPLILLGIMTVTAGADDAAELREYQVKAAFLYNFTKFVDWPEDKMAENDKPFIIGVICDKKHMAAFEPLEKEQVKGKNIKIKHFNDISVLSKPEEDNSDQYKEIIQSFRDCHLLFICDSAKKQRPDIIRLVQDFPVLTVTETADFSEDSSVMNFIKKDQKIRFEVSLTAAKKSNVKVRSGLLKLAIRVLGKEQEGEQ